MQKFFRNLVISAIVIVCWIALYQVSLNVKAAGAWSINSISTGTVTYTWTSLSPYVFFTTWTILSWDLGKIYITTSNSTWSLGSYSANVVMDNSQQFGNAPWNPTLNFGTGFETYTGTNLYLHVFITDAWWLNTWYLMQTITFIPNSWGGWWWPDREDIYHNQIYPAVSLAGINSNLLDVTSWNVSNFSGLRFENPWLGKITFQTWLDLTDSGVQDFLKNLSGYINIDNGLVSFNPTGSGADLNVNAQITMYFATGSDVAQDATGFIEQYSGNAGMIVARNTGGNIMPQTGDFILSMIQAQCEVMWPCELIFNTPHFTQFDIKPYLTAVHITSSNTNTAYAKSGDTVILSFTWSEILSWVTVTINGQSITPSGGGIARTAIFNITWGTTSGLITYTINYFDVYNNNWETVTGTTDATTVSVDITAPIAPVISNTWSTVGTTTIILTGTAESWARVDIYSWATLIASGISTSTFSISVPLITWANIFQAYATDLAGNLSLGSNSVTIMRDSSALTSTITYTTTWLTNQNVIAYISFNKTGVTIDTNGWLSGYTFTGNGSFIFNYHDSLTTGTATATVSNIDKTAPTATVIYSPTWLTNQNVIATLTGYAESITGTTTYTFTANGTYVFNFQDLAGNTAVATGTVSTIDKTAVTGSVSYSPATLTNQNVVATLSLNKTGVTVTNNSWLTGYTFTGNSSFIFTFQDSYGNTGSQTATVTWIDKTAPTATVTYTNTWANVLATLGGYSETLTGINATSKLFTWNGTYTFTFSDIAWNTWSTVASVIFTTAWTNTATWETHVGWATTTGVTIPGIVQIFNTGNTNNVLQISWVTITSTVWSWELLPPTNLSGGDSNNATTTELSLSSSTNTVLLTIQAWSTTDSLVASGGYFNVSFVVAWWANGDVLKLYRSTNGSTWTANTPDATCTLNSSLLCSFQTDHLSYFATVKTTTNGGWSNGGGGSSLVISTGTTLTWTKTIIKLSGNILNSPYSLELNNAYLYAYDIGITTMATIQNANMEWNLIRAHMAKMMVNYAIKVLGKTINTWATCTFTDLAGQTTEMKNYALWSCQLGLMGQWGTSFDPNGEVTRAQFGTILSRALYGTTYEWGTLYYLKHLTALKAAGIMNTITDPENMKEIRGYVMLMLMRAK